ncbi:sulfurtransferase TusA family protein [Streptomyces brasiliscabiei]|uniref:Sulfurtransferase TusA family protein n=1 Tax=Streptomyces brasiliscabiei TaxID=2736302 RepID=A0ABU8G3Y5_9ACTN
MTRTTHEIPSPDITVDGTGLFCVALLLRLCKEIAGTEPGTVVQVIATDPAAPLDLPAWCHMTGHHYLGHVADPALAGPVAGDRQTYALRLTADTRTTRPDAPWHMAEAPAHAPDSACPPWSPN